METNSVRAGSLPLPSGAAPAPTAPEAAAAAIAPDRYIPSRAAVPFAQLSARQKAWTAVAGAGRRLPGALAEMVKHPGQLLAGLTAPWLHPLRSLRETTSAVREAAGQGPLEAALSAIKGYGGLISAWGLPLSIALAPFTGGTSLVATAALVLGGAGLAAMGASFVKNIGDAAQADSETELAAQSEEILSDGLGLVSAAATFGAAKAAQGLVGRVKPAAEAVGQARSVVAKAPAVPRPKPQSAPKPKSEPQPAAVPAVVRSAAIVRKPLPAHPQAMEAAVADGAKFFQPQTVNYMPGLLKEAGFDGLPSLGSAAELDQAIARGARELYRGVADPAHAAQFRDGELFIGMKNANGSGSWAAIGAESRPIAARYATGRGVVMRMALKPDARVTTYRELTAMLKSEKAAATTEINARRAQLKTEVAAAASPEAAAHIQQAGNAAIDATLTRNGFAFEDLGRYGVLKGFDAIDMGETKFMNVLNRTALIVEETASPH